MQVEIRQSDAFVLHNFLLPIPVVRCSDLGQGGKKKFLEVQVGPVGKNMFSLSIALSIYGNLPKLYLPPGAFFPPSPRRLGILLANSVKTVKKRFRGRHSATRAGVAPPPSGLPQNSLSEVMDMGPPVEYVGGQLQREQTRPLPDVSADTLKRSRIVLKFSSNTSSAEPLVPHKPLTPPTPAEDHLIDEERDHAPNYHHP